jgi:hypothetical protein
MYQPNIRPYHENSHIAKTFYMYTKNDKAFLPEPSRAATHDLTLADELSVELGSVEREVNVKVDAVECALRCVHTLKIFFEVLSREI